MTLNALILAFVAIYLIILIALKKGWKRISVHHFVKTNTEVNFSIVIPFRNEAKHLESLLDSLRHLDYPDENYEVLFVNDFSEDNSADLIENYISKFHKSHYKLLQLTDNDGFGKKMAITKAINHSKNEWILCTDADCEVPPEWLKILSSFIIKNKPEMVTMPVRFKGNNSFFIKAQNLEFMSLIGLGAALIQLKKPHLCNGANLAYSAKAFKEVNGFIGNEHIASGDDIFLLKKISKKYPGKVMFLKNNEIVVLTSAVQNVYELLQQRKRWIAKTTKDSFSSMIFPLFVWLFHISILSFAIASTFYPVLSKSVVILFSAKIIGEALFILPVLKFFKLKQLFRSYLPTAFIYIFYVSFLPLLSVFSKPDWKNRKV